MEGVGAIMMRVFLGHSENEAESSNVAARSLMQQTPMGISIEYLNRQILDPIYDRPTSIKDGRLWDDISQAAMSTDHALARFWVPYLCEYTGWALFTDGDVLFRHSIADLFKFADDRYAVMCVQHPVLDGDANRKKIDAIQQNYPRKNWSSVMLWNCGHSANRALTLDYLNSKPGRDLHRFAWLADAEIGPLPSEWNYLVGVTYPPMADPAIAHFTLGTPDQRTYNPSWQADQLCAEWKSYLHVEVER